MTSGYIILRPLGVMPGDVGAGSLVFSGVSRAAIVEGEIENGVVLTGDVEYEIEIHSDAQAGYMQFKATPAATDASGVELQDVEITIPELYLTAYFRVDSPQYYLRRGDPLAFLTALGIPENYIPRAIGGRVVWGAQGDATSIPDASLGIEKLSFDPATQEELDDAIALLTEAFTTAIANGIAAHVAQSNPHTQYATSAQVTTAITNAINAIVGAAPTTLDTLAELAAAFGNNPDAIANLTTLVGTKVDSATLTEQVQDIVAAMVTAGANITATYNDAAGTLTIAATGGGGGGVDPGSPDATDEPASLERDNSGTFRYVKAGDYNGFISARHKYFGTFYNDDTHPNGNALLLKAVGEYAQAKGFGVALPEHSLTGAYAIDPNTVTFEGKISIRGVGTRGVCLNVENTSGYGLRFTKSTGGDQPVILENVYLTQGVLSGLYATGTPASDSVGILFPPANEYGNLHKFTNVQTLGFYRGLDIDNAGRVLVDRCTFLYAREHGLMFRCPSRNGDGGDSTLRDIIVDGDPSLPGMVAGGSSVYIGFGSGVKMFGGKIHGGWNTGVWYHGGYLVAPTSGNFLTAFLSAYGVNFDSLRFDTGTSNPSACFKVSNLWGVAGSPGEFIAANKNSQITILGCDPSNSGTLLVYDARDCSGIAIHAGSTVSTRLLKVEANATGSGFTVNGEVIRSGGNYSKMIEIDPTAVITDYVVKPGINRIGFGGTDDWLPSGASATLPVLRNVLIVGGVAQMELIEGEISDAELVTVNEDGVEIRLPDPIAETNSGRLYIQRDGDGTAPTLTAPGNCLIVWIQGDDTFGTVNDYLNVVEWQAVPEVDIPDIDFLIQCKNLAVGVVPDITPAEGGGGGDPGEIFRDEFDYVTQPAAYGSEAPNVGSARTVHSGTPIVTGNELTGDYVITGDVATGAATPGNFKVDFTFRVAAGGSYDVGIPFRRSDASHFHLFRITSAGAYRYTANLTVAQSTAISLTPGTLYTGHVSVINDVITCTIDGQTIFGAATDTTNNTFHNCGMYSGGSTGSLGRIVISDP